MLIVIPEKQGTFCGLADHASVVASGARQLGQRVQVGTLEQAWKSVAQTPLLIEYTPLAYSPIGLSWRLPMLALRWRFRQGRVVTYFHELPFTNGPGWRRQLAVLLQRIHCMLLASISNSTIVNQALSVGWLCWTGHLSRSRPMLFLPSCSNVGEALSPSPPKARPCCVVVFGSPGKRRHSHALVASLGGYRHLFGHDVVVLDIGESMALPPSLAAEVQMLGVLPAEVVKQKLLMSRFGLFYAEARQFSKSGVFAAYCACGVVPIIADPAAQPSSLFLAPSELSAAGGRLDEPDGIWQEIREWHARFSTSACTHHLLAHLYEP